MDLFNVKKNGDVLREYYKRLQWVRSFSAAMTKEIAGPYYGTERESFSGGDIERWRNLSAKPTNLLNQFFTSLRPYLAGDQITMNLSPMAAGLSGEAAVAQVALDVQVQRLELARTHGRVVDMALASGIGAYHCCTTESGERYNLMGTEADPGSLSVTDIAIDDLILDPTARVREEDQIRAARFRVSKTWLMDTGIFPKELVEKLRIIGNDGGGETKGEADNIGVDKTIGDENDDMVEGWNVAIRRGSRLYVGVRSGLDDTDFWLREPYKWSGGGESPIEVFGLMSVPGQSMPMTPLTMAIDLHFAGQLMASKMMALMLESDVKYVYAGVEGQKVVEALRDMTARNVRGDPGSVKEVKIPGPDAGMYNSFDWLKQQSNDAGMSLQQLAGSEAPSKLATGIAAVQAALASRVGMLQSRVSDALRRVGGHVLHDIYDDFRPREFMGKVGNLDLRYRMDMENKKGRADLFKIDVVAFSPESSDPNAKKARFAEFMQIGPAFLASVTQLGGDQQTAVRMLSKVYADPMIDDLFPTNLGQQVMVGQQQVAGNPQELPQATGQAPQEMSMAGQARSDLTAGQPQPAGAV